jgi:hypothetical protein
MPAKKISGHIRIVMDQLDKAQPLEAHDRIKAINKLYHLFRAIQRGAEILPPLYPVTDRATALVEAYRKTLKPEDILDDDSGPFTLSV